MTLLPHTIYDLVLYPLERVKVRELRSKLITPLRGRILEIGGGTGANFPYYSWDRIELSLVEPEPTMFHRAQRKFPNWWPKVGFKEGRAEDLPFPDSFFDVVLATLVFCTVADPGRGLQEVRRVLKPTGRLLLLEHVLSTRPWEALAQNILAPIWKRFFWGCHIDRDTLNLIRTSGFELVSLCGHWHNILLEIEAKPI